MLDGAVQFSTKNLENDNYTLGMTSKLLNLDGNCEKALIVGGGDLIIATHILNNYPQVKKLYLAEIDSRVIEVTR